LIKQDWSVAVGLIIMSERELNRIEVLSQVTRGAMSAVTAANVLGLSRRQVHRLLKTFQSDGAAAIRHKARGRRSNNRIDPAVREFAVTLVRENYIDFGPTFAAEKLAEDHGLKVSRETLRKWMQDAGIPPRKNAKLWKPDTAGARARNEAVRSSKYLGRALWRRWSGYHRRSRVETKMHCVKLLGQRLSARDFDRQVAEIQIRAAILNGFTALGIPRTVAVG